MPLPAPPESGLPIYAGPTAYWPTGHAPLDAVLGGGFAHGRVHEFYAADVDDASAAAGFAVAVALGMAGQTGEVLVLRSRPAVTGVGVVQGAGWSDLGGAPERALFGVIADTAALLRAAVDAMRSRALAAVMIESWGALPSLDLTAHRRLALAAEKSGVPLLFIRVDAAPTPSAAQTRWQIAAAPSQSLPGNAPGQPVFAIELLRQRGGAAGRDWVLEWDRDQRHFRAGHAAPLSGAVVPAPPRRTLALDAGTDLRTGDRAAA
jgi:protein ImuA